MLRAVITGLLGAATLIAGIAAPEFLPTDPETRRYVAAVLVFLALCLFLTAGMLAGDEKGYWQDLRDKLFFTFRQRSDRRQSALALTAAPVDIQQDNNVDLIREKLLSEAALRSEYHRSLKEYQAAVEDAIRQTTVPIEIGQQLNYLAKRVIGDLHFYVQELDLEKPWNYNFSTPEPWHQGEIQAGGLGSIDAQVFIYIVGRHQENLREVERRADTLDALSDGLRAELQRELDKHQ